MQIFKFGGTSVKNSEGVRNLYRIISQYQDESLVIVISAMGKMTNALENLARLAFENQGYQSELDSIKLFHTEICEELFGQVPNEVENWFIQMEKSLPSGLQNWSQYYDTIIPFGELLSTTIVHQYVAQQIKVSWMDARSVVKTNSIFTEANVDWQLTEHYISRELPKLLVDGPVITQGFIGSDLTGKTTTLGREGSDYTGAIFAYCLNAESFTVWKDVPGLLNADPKKFPAAELFDELSFQEVTELTFYGAKVIHPKTIRPLAQRGIPLFVRSFVDPDGNGTKISEQDKVATRHCFVFKENQLLVTLRVRDNSFMDEKKLVKVFQAMDSVNIKINLMHSSALTFTFCMDYQKAKLDKLSDYVDKDFQLLYNEGLELATIKNYEPSSFDYLPENKEIILEQKTRNNYQVLYRLK